MRPRHPHNPGPVSVTPFFIKSISWALARLPEPVCEWIAKRLGDLVFTCMRSRRWLILSNLAHAFPERSREWWLRTGRLGCRRMVETGMLALAHPHLTAERFRRMAIPHEALEARIGALVRARRPVVAAVPHLGAWELAAVMPLLVDTPLPPLHTMYRPLRNPHLDRWMRESRERFGVRTLSRKEGFAEGMRALREGGLLGVLFDQNARESGTLSLFFDRVCSTTNLPGLLVEKYDAVLCAFHARRTAFWRYRMTIDVFDEAPRDADGVTRHLDRWLEDLLRSDEDACASWLWIHNRWKIQMRPERRLRLGHKRSILPPPGELPRRTRFFVRLPADPDAVAAAFPALAALRTSRPDAALTAVVEPAIASLAGGAGVFDEILELPERRGARRAWARGLRWRFPDCWLVLCADPAAAREVARSGCAQRFGVVRPGRSRGSLSHAREMSAEDGRDPACWFDFLGAFGLPAPDREVASRPGL